MRPRMKIGFSHCELSDPLWCENAPSFAFKIASESPKFGRYTANKSRPSEGFTCSQSRRSQRFPPRSAPAFGTTAGTSSSILS